MTSICQSIRSYLPSTFKGFERALVAGLALHGACTWGIPVAIAQLGAYYFGRKYILPDTQEEVRFAPLPPAPPSRLDPSARLAPPNANPTQIIWKDNSCFCSSISWSFFTTEPAALRELPESISRRMNMGSLFPGVQSEALIPIAEIINKKALTLADFNQVRQMLQQFEVYGYPPGSNIPKLNALLTLLELHDFVREYQAGKPVSGDRVNALKDMVYRVNANFRDRGNRPGDAHEVFQTLADLIFEGSPIAQNITTTRMGDGRNLQEMRPNWGDIVLPMPAPQSKKQTLQSIFNEYMAPKNLVPVELGYFPHKRTYRVKETNQFDTPPPFLALSLKRGDVSLEEVLDFKDVDSISFQIKAVQAMNMDPVDVGERLELDRGFCRDGRAARYQLVSVSRHLGDFAHYDAVSRRPDGSWNYCNDLKKSITTLPKLGDYADTGYICFFRRIVG
jgi:hypothetical protein